MPFYKVGVSENVYYEEVIIEADDKEQAKSFFRGVEASGVVKVSDTDGLKYDYVEETEPKEHDEIFTKEECLKLMEEQEYE